MLGDVGQPKPVGAIGGELALHEIVADRRADQAVLAALLVHERTGDAHLRTQPPHASLRRGEASLGQLIGDEPIPERRIVDVNIDRGVDQLRLIPVPLRDRIGEPPVIGLLGELQDPARHRDGDAVGGEFTYERVEPFGPDRFACDR